MSPIACASGVDFDLRRDEPYFAYGELDSLRVVTREDSDCFSRFSALFEQVKAPEGSTYVWTENPLGLNGYYLASRGEKTPWRLKLRSASFNNVAVLPEILQGHVVADMVAILGSMFFVVGDIDK